MRRFAQSLSLWFIATLVALSGGGAVGEDRASLRITLTVPERSPTVAAPVVAAPGDEVSLCLAARTPSAYSVHVWVNDRQGPRLTGGSRTPRTAGPTAGTGSACTDARSMRSALARARRDPGTPVLLVVSPE